MDPLITKSQIGIKDYLNIIDNQLIGDKEKLAFFKAIFIGFQKNEKGPHIIIVNTRKIQLMDIDDAARDKIIELADHFFSKPLDIPLVREDFIEIYRSAKNWVFNLTPQTEQIKKHMLVSLLNKEEIPSNTGLKESLIAQLEEARNKKFTRVEEISSMQALVYKASVAISTLSFLGTAYFATLLTVPIGLVAITMGIGFTSLFVLIRSKLEINKIEEDKKIDWDQRLIDIREAYSLIDYEDFEKELSLSSWKVMKEKFKKSENLSNDAFEILDQTLNQLFNNTTISL